VNYESLTDVRNCSKKNEKEKEKEKKVGGDLLVRHFAVSEEFRVTRLTQHFAKYLSGVAI